MAKTTLKQLRQMVEELLVLVPLNERYKELEKSVKAGLVEVKHEEMEVPGKGRVFISQSERVKVSPELATEILGPEIARKVTIIEPKVSYSLINAFVRAGEISEEKREELREKAELTPVVSLYVRPLS